MKNISIKRIHNFASNLLKLKYTPRPRYEARLLLSKVLKKDLLTILIDKKFLLSQKQKKKFLKNIYSRFNGKPISRICGFKEFYSRNFFINKFTLDPRPDSEIMIDKIKKLKLNTKNHELRILDLGTGSGCLLITITLELEMISNRKISGLGIDLSFEALKVAKKNVEKYRLQNKIKLLKSNWFDKVSEKFDLIISNPPYIPFDQIQGLEIEVKNYDPILALNGGKCGLFHYAEIAKNAKDYLDESGYLCIEIYSAHYEKIRSIFFAEGFFQKDVFKDLSGQIRNIVFGIKKK
tara:strand:- start:609 stop:1487 length:879 start_codon:yes stop_codon:yes gene_type:complete